MAGNMQKLWTTTNDHGTRGCKSSISLSSAKPLGARVAILKTGRSPLTIAPDPLGGLAHRDVEAGHGQLQRHPLQSTSGYMLSTIDRPGVLVSKSVANHNPPQC